MGVKGLFKFIASKTTATTLRSLDEFTGNIIAMDASVMIYRWYATGSQFHNHIQGMLFRTVAIMEAGALPFYVFDGKPSNAKRATIEARAEARERGGLHVPEQIFDECRQLLALMGLPIIIADGEADHTIAALVRTGVAVAAFSDDSDLLTHGVTTLLRMEGSAKTNKVTSISLENVLNTLALTHRAFIDFCILLGTDYNAPIRGIGPAKALSTIQKYGAIEAAIAAGALQSSVQSCADIARAEYSMQIPLSIERPVMRILSDDEFVKLRLFLETKMSEPRIKKVMERLLVFRDHLVKTIT